MNKELEALNNLTQLAFYYAEDNGCLENAKKYKDIIEIALKEKEQDQKLYDKITRANLEIGQNNCNLTELVNKQLNDLIKLETVIDIIKEKEWLVDDILVAFLEDVDRYDLLKEILS